MTEFEVIKYLAELGGTVLAVGILGLILYRQQNNNMKERANSDKRYETLLKADQVTREAQTRALVSMYASIDSLKDNSFNVQNICAVNRKDCDAIREKLYVAVGKLTTD